jgi:predicted RNase H-like nuclease (RuvC/YqgF family)
MTNHTEEKKVAVGDQFATYAMRFFRFLLRFLVVLILGVALGAGAYYGVPALYRSVIQPVQLNTQRIAAFEASFQQEQKDGHDRLARLSDRLGEIEGSLANQEETLSELSAQAARMEAQLQALEAAQPAFRELESRVEGLETQDEEMASNLSALEEELAGGGEPIQVLARKLELMRALSYLNHAQLSLIKQNAGDAAENIRISKSILEAVMVSSPEAEVERLVPIVDRLDLALVDIQLAPIIAAEDLESAWQLLISAVESQEQAEQ